MVAEEDTLYYGATKYVTGFRLTEAGHLYGQPVAAFLLERSKELPYSLLEIFGQTSTSGKTRSVLNRVKILKALFQTYDNLRTEDIASQINLAGTGVGNHLRHLAKLGFADYSSVDSEERGQIKYELLENASKENIKQVRTEKTLTQDVTDLLFKLKRVDVNVLANRLKDKYTARSGINLKGEIGRILSGFTKQGICQHGLYIAGQIHSQARITEAGKQIVEDVIIPIEKTLSGDETLLSSWRRIPWQNHAREAILKYKEASGHAKYKSFEERQNELSSIILKNPGLRFREIKPILGCSPTQFLKILLEHGRIRKERQGKAVRYYPT